MANKTRICTASPGRLEPQVSSAPWMMVGFRRLLREPVPGKIMDLSTLGSAFSSSVTGQESAPRRSVGREGQLALPWSGRGPRIKRPHCALLDLREARAKMDANTSVIGSPARESLLQFGDKGEDLACTDRVLVTSWFRTAVVVCGVYDPEWNASYMGLGGHSGHGLTMSA